MSRTLTLSTFTPLPSITLLIRFTPDCLYVTSVLSPLDVENASLRYSACPDRRSLFKDRRERLRARLPPQPFVVGEIRFLNSRLTSLQAC